MSPEILFTLQVPSVSFLIGPRHPVILQRQFPHVQQPRATVTDMLIFALGAKPLLSSLFLVPRTLSTHLPTRGPDNCPPRATQRSFILLTGTLCLPDLRPSPLALCFSTPESSLSRRTENHSACSANSSRCSESASSYAQPTAG